MPLSQSYETLEKDILNLQLNITKVLTSERHYVTPDITTHIRNISNALDNIKLDYEFLRESKDWAKQSNANEIRATSSNIQQLIEKGNALTEQLNYRLHLVEINKKEHNQIRETHNWACDSLRDYLQSLYPYASNSHARLDNIAHHLGVTDRFVGYRNNLTRGGTQPLNVHTIWADRKLPQSSTPDWKDWTQSFHHDGSSEAMLERLASNNGNMFADVEEAQLTGIPQRLKKRPFEPQTFVYATDYQAHLRKAGIIHKYPGTSETEDRFMQPEEFPEGPSLSVAQPDYTQIGRPLAHLIPNPMTTEYTKNFKYPDSSKVEKFPWLRP